MEERFAAFTVLIAKINRNIRRIKTEEMAEFHLKGPHVACLYHLTTAGPLTAGELCDRCDEDKAAISRSLDFLEKEGYLVCDSSARKRYRSPLRLTEKGEATGRRIMEKIDRIAFAKVQTITCHGKDDYSFWSAEIPKDMLHSILHEACERVGTLDELMGAMNPKDGYEMRLFIQTPGRQFAFYRIPERLSNLEDYANEGCSVRGTKDEIMAEIFTEWAPAQEDLEDDFEL